MKNTQLRILFTVVGLSVLLLGLSCARGASNDAGTRGAGAPDAAAPSFTSGTRGAGAPDTAAPSFTFCNGGTYALCTEAVCTPLSTNNPDAGFLSCACDVRDDYSVGMELCAAVPSIPHNAGMSIPSRYHPPSTMDVCLPDAGNLPWASCLDMPCVIDSNNTNKATCVCVSSATLGAAGTVPFIVDTDTDKPPPAPCGIRYISSATFTGAQQMSCFLEDKGYVPPKIDGGWTPCPGVFIESKLNGSVIDVYGASTDAGAMLDAYPQQDAGTNNQHWRIVPVSSGYFFIQSMLNGYVIDIYGASTDAGAMLDAYPQKDAGTNNQLWRFVPDPAGSGYFFIQTMLNGYVINIYEGSTAPVAKLDAYPQKDAGTDNQLWRVAVPKAP